MYVDIIGKRKTEDYAFTMTEDIQIDEDLMKFFFGKRLKKNFTFAHENIVFENTSSLMELFDWNRRKDHPQHVTCIVGDPNLYYGLIWYFKIVGALDKIISFTFLKPSGSDLEYVYSIS